MPARKVHDPVPRDVQAVVIDAGTGRILGSREWPDLVAWKVALLATEGGNFAVRDTLGLAAYSSTFEQLKHIPLQDFRLKVFEEWRVLTTPSRKFIVLAHVVGQGAEVQWLLPASLAVDHSWALAKEIPRSEVFPHISASDQGIAVSRGGLGGCEVSVQDGPSSWHTVLQGGARCDGGVEFLDNSTLFVSLQGEFQALTVSGKLLWRQGLQKGERAYDARVSANGKRFAIPISAFKGGVDLLDIAPRETLKSIEVRDSQTGRSLYKVKGKLKNISGFALSPDGLRLALMRNGVAELYQLPTYDQSERTPH